MSAMWNLQDSSINELLYRLLVSTRIFEFWISEDFMSALLGGRKGINYFINLCFLGIYGFFFVDLMLIVRSLMCLLSKMPDKNRLNLAQDIRNGIESRRREYLFLALLFTMLWRRIFSCSRNQYCKNIL